MHLARNKLPRRKQRSINRNTHNRPKGRGINVPEAHKTFTRRVSGGLVRLGRI